MALTVNTRRLGYRFVADAVGDSATVISRFSPDTPTNLPAVLVDVSVPSSIDNGRQEFSASECAVRVACYAEDEDDAYDLALDIWASVHQLWRAQHVTQFGWIADIKRSSLQPHRVESPIENDASVCYQFVLQIVARA